MGSDVRRRDAIRSYQFRPGQTISHDLMCTSNLVSPYRSGWLGVCVPCGAPVAPDRDSGANAPHCSRVVPERRPRFFLAPHAPQLGSNGAPQEPVRATARRTPPDRPSPRPHRGREAPGGGPRAKALASRDSPDARPRQRSATEGRPRAPNPLPRAEPCREPHPARR